eukprot:jgi/Botrbrau1/22055/Bobra.0024s0065.1
MVWILRAVLVLVGTLYAASAGTEGSSEPSRIPKIKLSVHQSDTGPSGRGIQVSRFQQSKPQVFVEETGATQGGRGAREPRDEGVNLESQGIGGQGRAAVRDFQDQAPQIRNPPSFQLASRGQDPSLPRPETTSTTASTSPEGSSSVQATKGQTVSAPDAEESTAALQAAAKKGSDSSVPSSAARGTLLEEQRSAVPSSSSSRPSSSSPSSSGRANAAAFPSGATSQAAISQGLASINNEARAAVQDLSQDLTGSSQPGLLSPVLGPLTRVISSILPGGNRTLTPAAATLPSLVPRGILPLGNASAPAAAIPAADTAQLILRGAATTASTLTQNANLQLINLLPRLPMNSGISVSMAPPSTQAALTLAQPSSAGSRPAQATAEMAHAEPRPSAALTQPSGALSPSAAALEELAATLRAISRTAGAPAGAPAGAVPAAAAARPQPAADTVQDFAALSSISHAASASLEGLPEDLHPTELVAAAPPLLPPPAASPEFSAAMEAISTAAAASLEGAPVRASVLSEATSSPQGPGAGPADASAPLKAVSPAPQALLEGALALPDSAGLPPAGLLLRLPETAVPHQESLPGLPPSVLPAAALAPAQPVSGSLFSSAAPTGAWAPIAAEAAAATDQVSRFRAQLQADIDAFLIPMAPSKAPAEAPVGAVQQVEVPAYGPSGSLDQGIVGGPELGYPIRSQDLAPRQDEGLATPSGLLEPVSPFVVPTPAPAPAQLVPGYTVPSAAPAGAWAPTASEPAPMLDPLARFRAELQADIDAFQVRLAPSQAPAEAPVGDPQQRGASALISNIAPTGRDAVLQKLENAPQAIVPFAVPDGARLPRYGVPQEANPATAVPQQNWQAFEDATAVGPSSGPTAGPQPQPIGSDSPSSSDSVLTEGYRYPHASLGTPGPAAVPALVEATAEEPAPATATAEIAAPAPSEEASALSSVAPVEATTALPIAATPAVSGATAVAPLTPQAEAVVSVGSPAEGAAPARFPGLDPASAASDSLADLTQGALAPASPLGTQSVSAMLPEQPASALIQALQAPSLDGLAWPAESPGTQQEAPQVSAPSLAVVFPGVGPRALSFQERQTGPANLNSSPLGAVRGAQTALADAVNGGASSTIPSAAQFLPSASNLLRDVRGIVQMLPGVSALPSRATPLAAVDQDLTNDLTTVADDARTDLAQGADRLAQTPTAAVGIGVLNAAAQAVANTVTRGLPRGGGPLGMRPRPARRQDPARVFAGITAALRAGVPTQGPAPAPGREILADSTPDRTWPGDNVSKAPAADGPGQALENLLGPFADAPLLEGLSANKTSAAPVPSPSNRLGTAGPSRRVSRDWEEVRRSFFFPGSSPTDKGALEEKEAAGSGQAAAPVAANVPPRVPVMLGYQWRSSSGRAASDARPEGTPELPTTFFPPIVMQDPMLDSLASYIMGTRTAQERPQDSLPGGPHGTPSKGDSPAPAPAPASSPEVPSGGWEDPEGEMGDLDPDAASAPDTGPMGTGAPTGPASGPVACAPGQDASPSAAPEPTQAPREAPVPAPAPSVADLLMAIGKRGISQGATAEGSVAESAPPSTQEATKPPIALAHNHLAPATDGSSEESAPPSTQETADAPIALGDAHLAPATDGSSEEPAPPSAQETVDTPIALGDASIAPAADRPPTEPNTWAPRSAPHGADPKDASTKPQSLAPRPAPQLSAQPAARAALAAGRAAARKAAVAESVVRAAQRPRGNREQVVAGEVEPSPVLNGAGPAPRAKGTVRAAKVPPPADPGPAGEGEASNAGSPLAVTLPTTPSLRVADSYIAGKDAPPTNPSTSFPGDASADPLLYLRAAESRTAPAAKQEQDAVPTREPQGTTREPDSVVSKEGPGQDVKTSQTQGEPSPEVTEDKKGSAGLSRTPAKAAVPSSSGADMTGDPRGSSSGKQGVESRPTSLRGPSASLAREGGRTVGTIPATEEAEGKETAGAQQPAQVSRPTAPATHRTVASAEESAGTLQGTARDSQGLSPERGAGEDAPDSRPRGTRGSTGSKEGGRGETNAGTSPARASSNGGKALEDPKSGALRDTPEGPEDLEAPPPLSAQLKPAVGQPGKTGTAASAADLGSGTVQKQRDQSKMGDPTPAGNPQAGRVPSAHSGDSTPAGDLQIGRGPSARSADPTPAGDPQAGRGPSARSADPTPAGNQQAGRGPSTQAGSQRASRTDTTQNSSSRRQGADAVTEAGSQEGGEELTEGLSQSVVRLSTSVGPSLTAEPQAATRLPFGDGERFLGLRVLADGIANLVPDMS